MGFPIILPMLQEKRTNGSKGEGGAAEVTHAVMRGHEGEGGLAGRACSPAARPGLAKALKEPGNYNADRNENCFFFAEASRLFFCFALFLSVARHRCGRGSNPRRPGVLENWGWGAGGFDGAPGLSRGLLAHRVWLFLADPLDATALPGALRPFRLLHRGPVLPSVLPAWQGLRLRRLAAEPAALWLAALPLSATLPCRALQGNFSRRPEGST